MTVLSGIALVAVLLIIIGCILGRVTVQGALVLLAIIALIWVAVVVFMPAVIR